ncbi:MAG: LPS export ABC transporter permease LptG [Alphaproteobacteria bacterium]|nr:LPS export ABC transporter permease LptG [Alphaproteobacteria bacterium]
MRLSLTLSLYLGRHVLMACLVTLVGLAVLVFLLDVVEILRRAAGRDLAFGLVLRMASLKLPTTAQKLVPFAVLFGAMLAYVRLTRSHELVVVRAAGVSVWQFLAPALGVAAGLGMLIVAVINPVAASMASAYESLEARHLRGRVSLLAVSASGLWMRQVDAIGQSVIHALRVSQQGVELDDVIIFLYQGADRFVGRIDARRARLEPGHWRLDEALLTTPDRPAERISISRLDTSLTLAQLQESFASPQTLSFWTLPRFIDTLERTGFSGLRHRLYWHTLLALPALLCAMVLVAATFSLRLSRRGGIGPLVAGGVGIGFAFFFLADVALAFGQSGALPVVLAAWAPTAICALLGSTMLLHLEDG